MTDEEWERIKPLAEAEANAKLALENWGMANTPSDARKRIESMAFSARLQHDYDVARMALKQAMDGL